MKGLINVEKIKLSLVSGSSLEKPLVTAFKGNNGNYVVLDNEMNGTMGLPIILVSKLENNKLIKIADQNEWNAVKENLRMIIAGNQVDYISVDAVLAADDMFFSQLTLPVASFEALKNNYNPNGVSNIANGASTPTPVATPTPDVAPVTPSMPESPVTPEVTPASPSPVTPPNVDAVASEPVMPSMANQAPNVAPAVEPVSPVTPVVGAPTVTEEPVTPMPNVTPVMPEPPQNAQTAAPVMPEPVAPTSPVEPPMPSAPAEESPQTEVPVDFTADKEAFLKACENMFDALVAKFNK